MFGLVHTRSLTAGGGNVWVAHTRSLIAGGGNVWAVHTFSDNGRR